MRCKSALPRLLIVIFLFVTVSWTGLRCFSLVVFLDPLAEVKPTQASKTVSELLYVGRTRHGLPIYPPGLDVGPAQFGRGRIHRPVDDLESLTNESLLSVRSSHPRIIATEEIWPQLLRRTPLDPYLRYWNATIFERCEQRYHLAPVSYAVDGSLWGSGVLDVAREFQYRIKHWSYAYCMTGDRRWKDRIWEEIVVAAGNSSERVFGEGGDNWNSKHWLDVGEFLVAFAYAYDWLYEAWSVAEREAIFWSMLDLGIRKGLEAYRDEAWFLSVKGNWNCVTNGGMIIGSLAVLHEDPTGSAARLLRLALENTRMNCVQAVDTQGSWLETPDYWFFGTQAHAQLTSALETATGSTQGMLYSNSGLRETGWAHMYGSGPTEKFNHGDCGPNKITASANSLLYYGSRFRIPEYILYQRDQVDAADPLSMLWYDGDVHGQWWADLELHRRFDDVQNQWISMRSSWTDTDAVFVAMKGGALRGRQAHGNLDAGTFVLDALGERWAGELCQDDYLAQGYFAGEEQDSPRWQFYRCRTEGQNTLLVGGGNQFVGAGLSTNFTVDPKGADWALDLTEAYAGKLTSAQRLLSTSMDHSTVTIRDQIIESEYAFQWRMHTNATVLLDTGRTKACLHLNAKRLDVKLLSPDGVAFSVRQAGKEKSFSHGPSDLPNPGVQVLAVDLPPGSHKVDVQFDPFGASDSVSCE